MKILVACEYSGIVRDAFIKNGHDAMSCDLLPTEIPGPHYQGDVMNILNNGWDMLIGFPPCTYLSYAAMRVWNNRGRVFERLKALEFFAKLWEAPIDKICIENPRGCASPTIAKYSQIIQPYYFGDPEMKTTCLWLRNLPLLQFNENDDLFSLKTATDRPQPMRISPKGKKEYFTVAGNFYGRNRQHERSRFWLGIAEAMAVQWGIYLRDSTVLSGQIGAMNGN